MERFYSIFILLIIVSIFPIKAERLGDDAIIERARKFLELNKKEFSNKAEIDKESLTPYIYEGDTCYYSINITTGGWILLANETKSTPYLAYSFNGAYPTREEMPGGMQTLVDWYAETILVARELDMPEQPLMETASSVVVAPLLGNLAWGQSGNNTYSRWRADKNQSYNKYCPIIKDTISLVGCSAVALSQVLRYWKWPNFAQIPNSIGNDGTPSTDTHFAVFDYERMPESIHEDTTSLEQITEIARFVRDCGYAIHTKYGITGSGAPVAKTLDAIKDVFNYKNTARNVHKNLNVDSYWRSLIKGDLDDAQPVLYVAYQDDGSGHTFVVDGYRSDNTFHINWGWRGKYNNSYHSLTNTPIVPGNGYVYTQYFEAIVHIKPKSTCNTSSIEGPITTSTKIERSNNISTDVKIQSNSSVTIISKGTITLEGGFEVEAGSSVYIDSNDFTCY